MHDSNATSRRTVLKAGGVGVLAAAFLAACSDDHPVGVSGNPAPVTSVPPTVPPREPTAAELEEVQVQLRTLASVELVVADVYDAHGSRITDAALVPLVSRVGSEHREAAQALIDLTDTREAVEPNEFVRTNMVDPIEDSLTTEHNVRSLLRNLESSLTATYINAVQEVLEPEMRQTLMSHGGATARRVTALSDGVVPRGALFPSNDLISNSAFLRDAETTEGEGEAGEEGDGSGDGETAESE